MAEGMRPAALQYPGPPSTLTVSSSDPTGLSSEIRWFEIAWDLGQDEADPGVS